jgi:hypothetical protein
VKQRLKTKYLVPCFIEAVPSRWTRRRCRALVAIFKLQQPQPHRRNQAFCHRPFFWYFKVKDCMPTVLFP